MHVVATVSLVPVLTFQHCGGIWAVGWVLGSAVGWVVKLEGLGVYQYIQVIENHLGLFKSCRRLDSDCGYTVHSTDTQPIKSNRQSLHGIRNM
jgi:hypothetical protein